MKSLVFAAASAAVLSCAATAAGAADTAAAAPTGPDHYGAWGVDLSTGDNSVSPGDNFFTYAEGGWYAKAEIPGDQASIGAGYTLHNRAQAQLRLLIEESARDPKTPVAAKIGGLEAGPDENESVCGEARWSRA